MRYSPLIRRLVKASGEARLAGYDIADRLADRCLSETDVVRRTLYNAVCDPRFKLHADCSNSWKTLAREHLETFAQKLSNIDNLSPDTALDLLDTFLNRWLQLMMKDKDVVSRDVWFDKWKEEEKKDVCQSIKSALKEFMPELNADEGLGGMRMEEMPDMSFNMGGEDDSNIQDDNDKEEKDEEVEEENNEEEEEENNNEDEEDKEIWGNGSGNKDFGRGGGPGARQRIEDRFLKHIPQSLLELAKLIGRTGNDSLETTGTFLTAAKSDIAGITIGNELSCVLPSELALLASRATENIFLNNFVSRRLQIFSSASKSQKPGRTQNEGPIIICLDTSGSMTGEPVIMAKALTMALCIIAQRRKRKLIIVKYSSSHDSLVVNRFSRQKEEVSQFLSTFEMGGNNENEMFRWLFSDLLPTVDTDFASADVLCITDFGWAPISDEVMDTIADNKRQGMIFYGLNISPRGLFDSNDELTSEFGTEFDRYIFQYRSVIDTMWGYQNGKCFPYTATT